MSRLKRIITDFWGLCAVCGFSVGFRWLLAVITHFRASIRAGHLQLADNVLGDGPIPVRMGNARAQLTCYKVLTGIRETWVRDGYLGHGFLKIAPDALVVDLGSNMGAVTTLALAHGAGVRVVAVEADPNELPLLQKNLDLNGWADRVTIINAFIGGRTETQQQLLATDRAANVPTITQEELLNRIGRRINFLKCDIEGSEFELFSPPSPLLAASDQIAIEIHPHAGDADKLIAQLTSAGFELQTHVEPPTLTVLGRRPASTK
jgi:FkbM family methyltransferase